MAGGTGNDFYYVDDDNDVIWEWGGEGIDTVRAVLDNSFLGYFVLPSGVENIELTGFRNITLYGNELDNTMSGNQGNNILLGYAGNDSLDGGSGNDELLGGDGNDVLNGGAGADVMRGGSGDDTYHVDNFYDTISEGFNEGIDTVRVSLSYTLGDNLENLVLDGSATNAYGNGLNNVITGNGYDNEIVGGGGFDIMYGGRGADTFKFTSLSDIPVPGFRADYLADFSMAEGDKIDLSAIDANALAAGDQAFLFIGNNNAFVESWGAGQLRFNDGYLQGDVNGDMVADFSIKVNCTALTADAFIV
jgi:Ca2+-binding RTX toxin-like protein